MRNYQTALERCASICQLSSSVNRPAFKILTFDYELKNNVMLFASVKFCSPDLFRRLQLTKSIPRHSVFFPPLFSGSSFRSAHELPAFSIYSQSNRESSLLVRFQLLPVPAQVDHTLVIRFKSPQDPQYYSFLFLKLSFYLEKHIPITYNNCGFSISSTR